MKQAYATFFALAVLAGMAPHVAAQDAPPSAPPPAEREGSGWSFAITPYLWAAGLSGDVAQFGLPPVHISPDFGKVLDNLDFAAMATGEARKGRYSIVADMMFTKISLAYGTPRGALAETARVKSSTFAGFVGGGYSLAHGDRHILDFVLGPKIWNADVKIGLEGGLLNGRSGNDNATWVDAMGGLRGRYWLSDSLYLSGWGLIGGGGANIDWDAGATLGLRISRTASAVAGYRALGVDYDRDGFRFDIVQQGPTLGVSLNF
ncbi:hypothetical protein [Edaphosphingomonas haloaromaticamans]|uniref:Outer membrane protein beta-barrel domain-containing protein n=1 Tax=Edaphosphingomonas haloaromaticamans TaxID=653954 RepID=A0A1S1HEB7_9SPHN|nr:hypothetical protein [Sphingomonas haloaromaticamans]OHT20599.1 hypothetical protein BHE75_02598 [Sphingomonas haloaromaticamans]